MFLPEISIKRPVTAFMMSLAILVFGVIGYSRLGVDKNPRVDLPYVSVVTIMSGANPQVVEENVTDIVEQVVATVEGIKEMTSVSSHGASIVTLEFDLDRQIDLAAQDVRDRVGSLGEILPDDAQQPMVSKVDFSARPIMWVTVMGDKPIDEITTYAQDVVKLKLETLPGVGAIRLGGKREKALRVWLDREKLNSMEITSDEVINAFRRDNVELPGGIIESESIEFTIRVEGEYKNVDEFNNLVVAYRNDVPIRLSNVGYVVEGYEDFRSLARYRGKPTVGLGIQKKPGSNTVEIADLVKEKLREIKKDLPEGMEIMIAFDGSIFPKAAIKEMQFSIVFGALLAALVIFFFLHSYGATLITALAIPVSIFGTFLFMYFAGFTLNTMTLLALTLVIGVVIDDAIIVLENISRHYNMKKDIVTAARDGASEIAFAAIATTLALASVFIPIAFMEGVIGRFFVEFGLVVGVSVFISTFVALTLTPMLCSKFLKIETKKNKLSIFFDKLFSDVERIYKDLLFWSLSNRKKIIAIAFVVFISSLFIWKFLGKELTPKEDQSSFMISFETPVGSTINYTNEKLKICEDVLLEMKEIKGFFAVIGFGSGERVNSGILFVRMVSPDKREKSQEEIVMYLRKALNKEPGLKVFVFNTSSMFGSRRGSVINYVIKGPTISGLDKYSKIIAKEFASVEGIVDVDTNLEMNQPEIKIEIDRRRASDLGIDAKNIADTVNALVGGKNISTFKQGGKQYDIRAKLILEQRATIDDLKNLMVKNKKGDLIKLTSIVNIKETVSPSVVNRLNRQRSVSISANTEGSMTQGEAIEILDNISAKVLPEEYTTALTGSSKVFVEAIFGVFFALFLAIIITYMVLASLFESFIHPLTVMMALPLTIVGALGALFITGNTMNIYSMIGLVFLVGLVTKNSILLVDFTNRLKAQGKATKEALLKAGEVRLKPILMTAFSTIFGVLPTALAIGPGSESRAPMAVTVIGGLFSSTVLTLVVIPVVYFLIDDLIIWFKNKFIKKTIA